MSVLVGKQAPDFCSAAVVNGGEIVSDFSMKKLRGKYVLFFFYPADFTFVCPTELIAFQNKLDEFKKRNVEVVACSVDSEFSHWKWLQTPRKEGGIQGVKYPIVSDQAHVISEAYDVLAGYPEYDEESDQVRFEGVPQSYRGLFLIDKEGIVQHQLVNNMPLGRSVDEAIRMVDALQFFEEHGEVCPANWHQGEPALKPTQEDIASFLSDK